MELSVRSWVLVIFVIFTLYGSTLARRHRHHHGRDKRQHSPATYVLDVEGPESGDWGPWSSPAPCSRSCGGGVSFQERHCREDSRYPCEGASKRYFSCNIQDCPQGSVSFRAEQCSNFNNVPFDDVFYTWVPYTKAPNKCELNCMPRGERFYYRHKDKVADGTRCDEEKLDVCVDGKCLPVGCDHMLGSSAREDQCRECGGDGSSCNTVRGLLDMDDLQVGYNDLLLIPAGATNIRIQETRPSNNYLAIRNETGHYYLNGNWRIDFPRSIRACNTIFQYERKSQRFLAPEVISALGPISEPIYIVLLYQEKNPGIEYEYSIPKGAVQDTDPDGYSWLYNDFGPCSATCGGGLQTRNVWCAKRRDSAEVSRDLCNKALEPLSSQACAPEPCAPQWTVTEWGPCTQSCGTGGTQTRQVNCVQIISGGFSSLVNESACKDTLGPAPPTIQLCGEGPPCPTWHIGPWKPCDKLCGDGVQRRDVICFHKVDGKIVKLADGACPGEKPEQEVPCNLRPCEGVDWVVTEWSGCEDKCGLAFETRQAFCTTEKGELHDDKFCHKSKVPELKRECNTTVACQHQWFASQWSECSAQCGQGIQSRKVFCGSLTDEGVEKTEDDKCDAAVKYSETKNCTGEQECKGNWFAGPWSTCSKLCGGGQRSRKVLCMLNNVTVPALQCDLNEILFANEDCNNNPCGTDQIITVAPEHKVYEDYDDDEDCDEDYEDEDIITTEGVQMFSTDFEGSGASPASTDDQSAFSTASDSSSFSSEGLMLSDEPSSVSTSGASDTSLLVSFESTDTTESSVWSTDVEGSGESAVPTEVSIQSSDVSSDSSAVGSSESPLLSSESASSVESSSDIATTAGEVSESSSDDVSSSGVSTESSLAGLQESSNELTTDSAEVTTLPSNSESAEVTTLASNSEASSSSESASEKPSDSTPSAPTETTPEVTTPQSESSPTSDSSVSDASVSGGAPTTDSSASISEKLGTTSADVSGTSESATEGVTETAAASESGSSDSTTAGSEPSASESGATSEAGASSVSSSDASIEVTTSSDITGATEDSSVVSSDVSGATEDFSVTSPESSGSSEDSATTESSPTGASSDSSESSSDSSSGGSSESSSEAVTEVSSSDSSVSEDLYSVTSPSYGASTTELISIFSPDLTKEAKSAGKKKCKRRPKKPSACLTSEYGCCYDNKTAAQGPFNKGCPVAETCKETKFGCCQDGVSPAKGRKYRGCPLSQCKLSLFGCCPDGITESQGNDNEGCPVEPTTVADESCNSSEYGCCQDGLTAATGPDFEGCDLVGSSEEPVTDDYRFDDIDCVNTTHGCCPDGIIAASGPLFQGCEGMEEAENCSETAYGCCPDGNTTASGPDGKGCKKSCSESQFGCCQDNETPAHGPNKEGCCLLEKFGCCPDNILPAQGPSLEGCGCQYSTYGCCPDNKTVARGADNQGCGCQYTPHGCCPNQYTPAAGPGYQGCPCYTYQFGCCPDGITRAVGPNLQGCGCENTPYGCCADGRTPVPAPGQPCPCVASKYGCCPDGVSEAMGENFENCQNIPPGPGEQCTLQKDRGSCREFTVKWFYDTEYGGCSRFWYGGCDGNDNRFKTQEECRQTCVEPPGRDACYLPKIEGPCEGYYPTWYYDAERKQCGQFVYGGCLGNNNKFETREMCEELCVTPDIIDACEKPKDSGPCQGNFTRWFYDKEAGTCSMFNYGGCKGNNNNFQTEVACQQKCLQPGRSKDECALPRAQGSCSDRLPRWFFDASENRCSPFYYSGCDGNGNNFDTRDVCEAACPPKVEQHTCLLPALVGDCHNYTARWYYDSLEAQCRQFYFGGCGGNNNNFLSQEECQRSCEGGYAPQPPQQVYDFTTAPPQPRYEQPQNRYEEPQQPFSTDMCFLPDDAGECSSSIAQWFYDSRDGVCKQFIYGGCGGNGNRYSSRQECEARCGNVQDLCTLPRVVGPCDGNELQYYYDYNTDSCYSFDYGGCQGNANRFASQGECEQRCRRAPPPPPPTSAPALIKSDICYQPVDKGPCTGEMAAWFFDPATGQCQTFVYGGCQGNANRFSSIEQCERQCGQFLGQDVCNVGVDIGPCQQQLTKWYFDPATRSCQEFRYGGCEGTANRFSSVSECESVCLHREELIPTETNSSMSYLAICRLPIDSGPCLDAEFTRWAFDEQKRTCVAFTYHGCAGNLNRFKSFKACLDYCLPGHSPVEPVTSIPNVIDTDWSPTKDRCEEVQSECASLSQCPYGVERWVDANGCDNCRCFNPCVSADPHCPPNMTCAIAPYTNPQTGQTEYRAVCRELNKMGECPQLREEASHCSQECINDGDCSGTAKCCYNGCGTSCLEPAHENLQTAAPDTYHPGGSAPEIETETPDVEADEGYFVTLRCVARGNPSPTVIWIRGGATLSAVGGRYKFLTDGSLQIVGLTQSDGGEYICVADNGIGEPARKVFQVRVRGAKDRSAEVLGDDSQSVVVGLGSRAVLQCYAYGYPAPSVTWWRGERMLPFVSAELEQRRDFSLVLHSVTLTSLGPYTCQAYNGKGRAASWTVILKAVGPVYSPDPNDVTYNQYLVPPPRSPPDHQVHPRPYNPPYRPVVTVPPTIAPTVRVYIVPVKTNITMDNTTVPVDSDISIPCDVEGHPQPKVIWYKDNQILHPSDRIQISESRRLTVIRAGAADAGVYKCEAANQYSSSFSEVDIRVEGVYVDPVCTDNTFFANCALVVKGKYCTHQWYSKFCCRSCTLDGQLPSYGPHLEALQRRRRHLVNLFH